MAQFFDQFKGFAREHPWTFGCLSAVFGSVVAKVAQEQCHKKNVKKIAGALVVVTGASSGIGQRVAQLCAQHGATVVCVARTESALQETVRGMSAEAQTRAHIIPGDLGDAAASARVIETIKSKHGIPNIIINCAGAGEWKSIEETTVNDVDICMRAPFYAAAHLTLGFSKDMILRGSGHIVNVNSPAGVAPWPGCVAYAAARSALKGWNDALRVDLRGSGVSVAHITLGEVHSPYFTANNVDADQLPGIARVLPSLTVEGAAQAVFRAAVCGKSGSVTAPCLVSWVESWQRMWPASVEWLMCLTSKKRTKGQLKLKNKKAE